MNKLPSCYKEKDEPRCSKCKNVFVYTDYEESIRYFCTLNQPKRPLCGSVLMDEMWETVAEEGLSYETDADLIEQKIRQLYDEWNNWSDGLEVDGQLGSCSNFKEALNSRD